MSDFTRTPNYALYKPAPNADIDAWGAHLNWNADTLDSTVHGMLPLAGGTLTGPLTINYTQNVTTAVTSPLLSNWNANGVQTGGGNGWTFGVVDNLDARTAGSLNVFYVDDVVQGNAGGGRNGIFSVLALTAPTRDALVGPHGLFYNAIGAEVWASANQGGTSASASANLVAVAAQATANSGGTYLNILEAIECGAGVATGGSAAYVNAIKASPSGSVVPLHTFNAYAIGGAVSPTPGFAIGFCFCAQESGAGHFGIATTGTLIGTNLGGTVAHGIDLSLITCTADQFKGAGIIIDGSGHVSPLLTNAANDTAAATAGVPIGAMYRNGNAVQVRLV